MLSCIALEQQVDVHMENWLSFNVKGTVDVPDTMIAQVLASLSSQDFTEYD